MNKQKSAFYNGIKFVDIDKQIDLPTDFETDRIPNKGDVMCFNSIIGNESTYYHCVVLYVYDQRTILSTSIEEGEIFQTSIYVVTKKIEPELGEKTWKSILENLAKDNQLGAYKHNGFWKPMDTLKDKQDLNEYWEKGIAEWKIWE